MIVDANSYLSRWPLRRTPCDELPPLLETYRKGGVGQAWVASLDGLLHRDLGSVNRRLAEECRRQRQVELRPFGSVNPILPDWREELRRCHEDYQMRGIRLHPGYHRYGLDQPESAELLDLASRRGLIVQLVVRMDDVRVQHPLLRVKDVDCRPLLELVRARPNLRLVLLGAQPAVGLGALRALAATRRVWFDIAMQEGIAGVATLAEAVSADRVLFGSHLPLFSLESALLKIEEAALDRPIRTAIESDNARQLLGGA